jgi:hypothetical protein
MGVIVLFSNLSVYIYRKIEYVPLGELYASNIYVDMKTSIFWYITPYSPVKVSHCFGGTRQLLSSLAACFMLVSYLVYSESLEMEVTCTSKTSVDFHWTTQRFIPEDITPHNHCCENLKSYIFMDNLVFWLINIVFVQSSSFLKYFL